jgi:iron complex outermembrane receptor protein
MVFACCTIATITEAADATAVPTAEPDTSVLGEIIVTAQKRSESAENVPISIATVSGAALQTLGVPDVTSLPQVVPGLRIDFSGAFSQPTIRGVGSALLGPGLSSNVATYVDGIIRPSSLTNNIQFDDISSINVLKGPQGTLFGRNATGGAILINTNDPTFDPRVRGHVAYSSYHTVDMALSGSTGFTDTLAGSISLAKTQSDGFIHNVFTGGDAGQYSNYGIRAKLLYTPTDSAAFLFSYEHLNSSDNRATALNNYSGWSDGALFGANAPSNRGTVANDFPSFAKASSDAGSIKATFDFNWATLTSYTGGQWEHDVNSSDIDGSSAPIVGVDWRILDRTFSQEFDLGSSKSDSLTWVTGLYYYNNHSEWPSLNLSLGGAPSFTDFATGVNSKTYAIFGDVTKTLIDNLYLTVGARYGSDNVHANFTFIGDTEKTPSHTWSNTTPRVVLRYKLDPQSNVYASFTQGYKAGVFNAPGNSTTPVNPEKINAYEIGYKTARARWRFDAAAYYYNYKDLQVTTYTQNGSVLVNAANSRIYGLDTSLQTQITSAFSATLSAAYTHARYVNFPNAPDYTFSSTQGVLIGTKNASGFQMERAPEFQGDLILNYSLPLLEGKLDLSTLYSYETKVYFDPVQLTNQGAYGLLNARAQWTAPSGHWDVAVFGKNITNKTYITEVLPDSAYFGQAFGTPATVGIEVGVKY